MRPDFRLFLFVLILLPALPACRTESEIRTGFGDAANAARAAQWNLGFSIMPMAENLREFTLTRFAAVDRRFTDSGLLLGFGSGIQCPDGFQRRGQCVMVNGYSLNGIQDTCTLKASISDSFAIAGNGSWLFFIGSIRVTGQDYYRFTVETRGAFHRGEDRFPVNASCTVDILPEGKTGRSAQYAQHWSGTVATDGGGLTLEDVIKQDRCNAFFSAGTATFSQGNSLSKILFDAYGNGACDQVFKITGKRDEGLFNLW